MNRNTTHQDTYKNTQENGNKVRFVKAFKGVTQNLFYLSNGIERTYNGYAVAHLQVQFGVSLVAITAVQAQGMKQA